jgi:L-fuculose-phosphate aldolase
MMDNGAMSAAQVPHGVSRHAVFSAAVKMWRYGLVVASAGNVSARVPGEPLVAITPTSIPYDVLREDEISVVRLEDGARAEPGPRPSGELPTHLAVYRARPDVGAVIHTHAPAVSSLSVLGLPLPPVVDEMVVYFGGVVAVADYAFTGTEDLAANVVAALGDRAAVLLSNHGNVCVGRDLDEALHVALTMESTARAYLDALRVGTPKLLPEDAIRRGREMYEKRRLRAAPTA